MVILAVYYTLADIVLLGQCFYYRGFTLQDEVTTPTTHTHTQEETGTRTPSSGKYSERSALLPKSNGHSRTQNEDHFANQAASTSGQRTPEPDPRRRPSTSSFHDIIHPHVDGTHLSPATPFIEPTVKQTRRRKITALQKILSNASAIVLVCAAGILGWYVSASTKRPSHHDREPQPPSRESSILHFDPLGQTFGYLCAVFYLGSRLPQILLNFRRKSTEGVSFLFFLFACIGNLTYVLSILAYSPVCGGDFGRHDEPRCRPGEAGRLYGRYLLVNLSWLLGSFGTLLLDMCIFAQFFLYKDVIDSDDVETDTREELGA